MSEPGKFSILILALKSNPWMEILNMSDSLKPKLCNARRASKQDNKTGYTEGKSNSFAHISYLRHWKPKINTTIWEAIGESVKAIGGTASVNLFPQGQEIAKASTSDM